MDKSTQKLILGFVTLILGIAFVSQIATSGNAVTQPTSVYNETLNIAPARLGADIQNTVPLNISHVPTTWQITDCPITNLVMRNRSGTTLASSTNYDFTASTGQITLKNATVGAYGSVNLTGANSTYVDYNYCADTYINQTFGRTAVNLIPGLFAIALFVVSIGLFVSVFKDNGIWN